MPLTPYMLQRQQMKLKGKTPTSPAKQSADNRQEGEVGGSKPAKPRKNSPPAKKKGIKKVSKKRAKQQRQYTPVRKKFLQEHPSCEIPADGCTGIATEVHHSAGRENGRLLKLEDFKAACRNCHDKATEKSREAIAAGHSKTRTGKPDRQIPGNVTTEKK